MKNTAEMVNQFPKNIKCGLCGYSFTSQDCVKICKACPSFMQCNLIKCPNCGYEFPPLETIAGRLLKAITSKIKKRGIKYE
ncbi:MAG: hypothetical protein ACFFBD_13180 [Candidatus Hodarchaeota archaeon]